ncbi:MAG: GntR family transcriptional regulator [Gaiella sp.]
MTIERHVLRNRVRDILLQRIASGELPQGERIVETRIAAELGTSQAPVREALRELELYRLVESEPFRGARVRAFGDDELIEIYPVRASLEELAARLAAPIVAEDPEPLRAQLEAMTEAAAAGDIATLSHADIGFHRAIVAAASNSILEQCWRSLGVEGRIAITLYGTRVEPGQAVELHVPLFDALVAGEADLAAAEARAHVELFARIAMAAPR